ncbi:hypothetical protein [Methylobacterium planeticum]|uniref:Uncharacterized protein n=1 Tax=Methylobacterium planeticum TaxID=2615211 RepID=A0A6N6MGB5_9HYPH|nr:hypothetical protein [Methylobacterium planeticum]KAB1069937.1 hypothetical protein F6X51_24160 [Methylobacterium planeticum]
MGRKMRPLKIVICDDTNRPLSDLVNDLQALAPEGSPEIKVISGAAINPIARELEARRRWAAHVSNPPQPGAQAPIAWGTHAFDEVDILILDYNFIELEDVWGLTGQRLAYLARCYSNCKYIVVLNQFGTNRFDLTLRGHPETHADLHIGSEQLTNPGLWRSDGWSEFRPWSWPVLPDAVARLECRIAQVTDALDAPVMEWLGLEHARAGLPRTVLQFLKDDRTTFKRFIYESGHGFESTDREFDQASLPRIAASRIAKWLEYLVFAGQDLLIDVPRLISRFPSLIGTESFTRLQGRQLTPAVTTGLGLREELIADHAYPRRDWLSRAAWFRTRVMDEQRLPENAEDRPSETDLRFCEDTSSFLERNSTRGFVADLASPYVQRFVRRPGFDGVEYQPSIRFSL